MTGTPAYLACDWGTTSLRAWVLDKAGAVVRSRDFPLGDVHADADAAIASFGA